tara:strand:+ start:4216 stop:5211 length:996 start_codon:yes stop_codon:yes gene_type:complete
MNQTEVICVGEALIDRIVNKSDLSFKDYLGGAPANVACALSKLNINSSFIGRLGDDQFGKKFIDNFKRIGIDTRFLQCDDLYPTRIVRVLRDKFGDRFFSGFENYSGNFFADEMLDKSNFEENLLHLDELLVNAKYIVTGTILLSSNQSSDALIFLLNHIEKFNIKVIVDLNWRDIFWSDSNTTSEPSEKQLKKIINLLHFADTLKFAKEEAILFFNNCEPLKISKFFPKGPDVLITDGKNPISWYINGIQGNTKAFTSNNIIDTTGAGDAFLAGFISQMINSSDFLDSLKVEKIIKFASACGLLTCLSKGAIMAQPDLIQVQKFLKSVGW